MNIQQLKSLAAIMECQSFSRAANKIGLSHSAISLQIKALEEEFGQPIFDRTTRPPTFLDTGLRAAQMAQKALRVIEDVKLIGAGKMSMDAVAIGVVPTTLRDILPFILKQMQQNHPHIRMRVKSGLSGDLTSQVMNRELDVALVTAPASLLPGLHIHEIAAEPLYTICDKSIEAKDDRQLLETMPYIAFSRKTWLGQQISARLQSRGIYVNEIMEVNSLDAIERMVAEGYGISIVPQRFLAHSLSKSLTSTAFCNPQEVRRLVLIRREEIGREKNSDSPVKLILEIIYNLVKGEKPEKPEN